jgi:hypothetical protein
VAIAAGAENQRDHKPKKENSKIQEMGEPGEHIGVRPAELKICATDGFPKTEQLCI